MKNCASMQFSLLNVHWINDLSVGEWITRKLNKIRLHSSQAVEELINPIRRPTGVDNESSAATHSVLGPSSLLYSCDTTNNASEYTTRNALLHYVLSTFARRTTDLPTTRAHLAIFPQDVVRTRENTNNKQNPDRASCSPNSPFDWLRQTHSAHMERHVLLKWTRRCCEFENAFEEKRFSSICVYSNWNAGTRRTHSVVFRRHAPWRTVRIAIDEARGETQRIHFNCTRIDGTTGIKVDIA